MLEVFGTFIDPRPPHRALLIGLNDEGDCQLAIIDGSAKVDGHYPILGKVVVPLLVLESMVESLPAGLKMVSEIQGYEPPSIEEMIDNLRPVSAEIQALNDRERQRKAGESP